CDAGIVLQFARRVPFFAFLWVPGQMRAQHFVAVLDHRAELEAAKDPAVAADSRMAVDHFAAVGEFDQKDQHQEKRAEDDDAGKRRGYVERALESAANRRLPLYFRVRVGSPLRQSGL